MPTSGFPAGRPVSRSAARSSSNGVVGEFEAPAVVPGAEGRGQIEVGLHHGAGDSLPSSVFGGRTGCVSSARRPSDRCPPVRGCRRAARPRPRRTNSGSSRAASARRMRRIRPARKGTRRPPSSFSMAGMTSSRCASPSRAPWAARPPTQVMSSVGQGRTQRPQRRHGHRRRRRADWAAGRPGGAGWGPRAFTRAVPRPAPRPSVPSAARTSARARPRAPPAHRPASLRIVHELQDAVEERGAIGGHEARFAVHDLLHLHAHGARDHRPPEREHLQDLQPALAARPRILGQRRDAEVDAREVALPSVSSVHGTVSQGIPAGRPARRPRSRAAGRCRPEATSAERITARASR